MKTRKRDLTAKEAADRVAARYARARAKGRDPNLEYEESDESPFCCENCGHDSFVVEEWQDVVEEVRHTLQCTCEEGDGSAAAEYVERITSRVHRVWALEPDHRYGDELNSPEQEYLDREIISEEINCEKCHSDADDDDWEVDDEDDEAADDDDTYPIDDDIHVCCEKCGHEVEFGFSSHEGGLIWPCESKDFNPWKAWPHSRYIENWRKRGWLRPANAQAVNCVGE